MVYRVNGGWPVERMADGLESERQTALESEWWMVHILEAVVCIKASSVSNTGV
jgi:hypothetical protein